MRQGERDTERERVAEPEWGGKHGWPPPPPRANHLVCACVRPLIFTCISTRVCLPVCVCVCVAIWVCCDLCVLCCYCCCCCFFYHLSGCACGAAWCCCLLCCCLLCCCCSRHHIERQARAWTKRKWGGHTAYSAVPCRGIIIVVDVDVDVEVGSSARPTNLLFAYSKISLKIVYSLVWHEMKVSFGPQVNVLSNVQHSPRTPFCTLQKLNGDAAPFSMRAPSIGVCVCERESNHLCEQRLRRSWGRIRQCILRAQWKIWAAAWGSRMRRGNFLFQLF